jgi:transmembrane sensor
MKTPDKIETEACLWVVRLERGLTPAEQDDFLQWLMSDPRHGAELARHKSDWNRLDLLADWRPENSTWPNRDLLAARPQKLRLPTRTARWWLAAGGLAAAAALALLLTRPPEAEVRAPVPAATVPAPIALIEQRTLEDGSVIELNRGAQVAVLYSTGERRVRLEQGEASFRVAKNPERPFIVSVGGVEVRAVGTEFNVRLAAAALEVVVTEGKVRLDTPARPGTAPSQEFLETGQTATVALAEPAPPRVARLDETGLEQATAWRPRLLDFPDTRLDEIVAEFNRRNAPLRLVLADTELAGLRVSASLRSDNVEGFIRLLEGGFAVAAERTGDTVTLRKTRM